MLNQRARHAERDGDRSGALELLAPEFQWVDRRRLGLGTMDRDEYVRTSIVRGGHLHVDVEYVRQGDGVVLARLYVEMRDGSEWEFYSVNAMTGSSFQSFTIFDLDDLDAAVAEYERLATTHRGDTSTDSAISNTASRVLERSFEVLLHDGLDAHVEFIDPDFHFVSRRSTAMRQEGDPDEWRDAVGFWLETGIEKIEMTTSAIRAEALTVGDLLVTTTAGDEWGFRYVVEISDGKIIGLTSYDTDGDGLHAALDLLDERYIALGGPSDVVMLNQRARHAERDGDRARALALLAPDFHFDDRRRLGLGSMDRDEYVRSGIVRGGHLHVDVEYVRQQDGFLLVHSRHETRESSVWEFYCVYAMTSSSFVSSTTFDIDDLDAAIARYDELAADASAATASEPDFANAAWRAFQAGDQAMNDGDKERYLDGLAPDFRMVARTPFHLRAEIDKFETADTLFVNRSLGATHRSETELVALRGDDLCLVRVHIVIDDNVQAHLVVVRMAQDRVDRVFAFDDTQLREALQELDRQYAAALGLSEAALEGLDVLWSLDPQRIASWLHPDFRFRDHRGIGWPDMDRDRYLSEFLPSIPAGITMIVRQIDTFVEGRGMVEHHSLVDADGTIDTAVIGVSVLNDEQSIAFEVFAPDDLAAARARFAELTRDDDQGSG
jgi:hypothetical protein